MSEHPELEGGAYEDDYPASVPPELQTAFNRMRATDPEQSPPPDPTEAEKKAAFDNSWGQPREQTKERSPMSETEQVAAWCREQAKRENTRADRANGQQIEDVAESSCYRGAAQAYNAVALKLEERTSE